MDIAVKIAAGMNTWRKMNGRNGRLDTLVYSGDMVLVCCLGGAWAFAYPDLSGGKKKG